MGSAVEVAQLTRTFEGGVEALAGLDLVVREGEIVALLGPNGAGKTTTIRILVTLLRPTSGAAHVLGHDVVSQAGEVRKLIGVTLQEAAFDPTMSAVELVSLHAAMYGLGKDGVRRGRELLTDLGLDDAAERKVMTFSGGMRRRLDLALALVHEPRVLFLDEPTTGLDPSSRRVIWERVQRLKAAGTAVLLTTHYLEEADQLADRVTMIDHGRVVAEGAPSDLRAEFGRSRLEVTFSDAEPSHVEAILKRWGEVAPGPEGSLSTLSVETEPSTVADVLLSLQEAGVSVQSLDIVRPTLEDVFIAKTGRRLEGARMQDAS